MSEKSFTFNPIGVIHSPFEQQQGTPIQPTADPDAKGMVEVFSQYEGGLQDLEGFDRIILIYVFDRMCQEKLTVIPFLDTVPHGVFATRAPCRPNKIGISCVRLLKREKNMLEIQGVDVLDKTPLLDIKPYIPQFDCFDNVRSGWVEGVSPQKKADKRFE